MQWGGNVSWAHQGVLAKILITGIVCEAKKEEGTAGRGDSLSNSKGRNANCEKRGSMENKGGK